MANDAEVNLKVNLQQPSGTDVERLLAQIKKLGRFTREYLAEAAKSEDVAEAAKIGRERAARVGEEVAKNWENGFADGFKNVAMLGRSQRRISEANTLIGNEVSRLEQKWRAGELSDEAMAASLARGLAAQETTYEQAGNLKNMAGGAEQDLFRLEEFDELLSKHERFSEQIQGEAEGARVFAAELRKAAGALEEEAEALDLTIPANEKRKLQLLQLARENRTRANAAEKVAEVIEAETAAIRKNLEAVDGSAEAYEKANKAIARSEAKALDQSKKLAELGAKQAESDQKQVVAEQQLAEQQERRAAAEAKRARQEELLREKEIFQTELTGKKKLELARIIRQLNADRAAAAKAGDTEALKKLNIQLGVARSAMSSASMAANITRMMFMQQAQTAQSLATNLSTVATGFSGMAEAAKNGELNLTGMASSLVYLFQTLKAGLGPIGAVMLALQGAQSVFNSYAKTTASTKELEKSHTEIVNKERSAYQALESAARRANEQRDRENAVKAAKADYDELNKALKTGLDLIEAQLSAELRRMQLTQDDAQFQRTLKKHELGRALAEGKMTRMEYDLAMLDLDNEAAVGGAKARTEAAKAKERAASRKREELAEDAIRKGKLRQTAADKAFTFKVSKEEVDAYQQKLREMEQAEAQAEEKLNALIKKAGSTNISNLLASGAQNMAHAISLGWIDSGSDLQTKELEAAEKAYYAAQNARVKYKKSFTQRMGGRTVDKYLADKAAADQVYALSSQQAEAAQKALEDAMSAETSAKQAASIAAEEEQRVIKQQGQLRETKTKDLETRKKEEEKAKARQAKIDKRLEELQHKSLSDIEALSEDFRNARGKTEGSQKWQQYSAAMRALEEEKKRRAKRNEEVMQAARIEALNDRTLGQGGTNFESLRLNGILDAWADSALTSEEVAMLKTEMAKARKRQNETVQQLIRTILAEALETEKTEKKVRRQIFNLKKQWAL